MATVLVVDDVTVNREVMSTLLSCRGHEVLEARDGIDALNVVRDRHPDLVVSDVLMPGIDGLELVHRLRTGADPLAARAPVIFYTANYLDSETRPFADTYGVSRVVLRSADPSELLDAVDEVLRSGPVDVSIGATVDFDRVHSKAVNAKLVEKTHALRHSERQFEAMATASPVGIALLDADGHAVYVNPRLTEITGSSDLTGDGWQICLEPGDRIGALPGEERRFRTHLIRGDDGERWLRVHLRPFGDSLLEGAVVMVDDISDVVAAENRVTQEIKRRQEEAAAHDADRMDCLRRMAGGVAEDFDDVVGAMLGCLRMIRSSITEDRDAGRLAAGTATGLLEDLAMVTRRGERAAELTARLLALGRSEVNEPTAVDVTGFLRAFAREAGGADILVDTRLATDTPCVSIDRRALDRLLQVLFRNACEAMPRGGIVTICSSAGPASTVRIELVDTGGGMTPEVRRRAFEPFFTTKTGSRTAGLGLSIAQQIASQAGGSLRLHSGDGGTRAEISLPAC
ncbi:histidine kinase [Actinoplanes sp. OR16]|uniref:ATP-binding response regulator n=1 Tax=Actinoplanes sp. OR16 TaxID=946334 RepID=UPI000F70150D|nr:response regulator [Actinoplanes sp. OR16]BBH70313.1 histidine kinase [Actinoplanes sp. OR16]